eukprot:SAG31_NODE_27533_length_424_cov_1.175385_2_plen_86_part_01
MHDEFNVATVSYTWSKWDNATVFLDPTTMKVKSTPGHLTLLTLEHELTLAEYVQSRGGVMYGNGAPQTRTWMQRKALSFNFGPSRT